MSADQKPRYRFKMRRAQQDTSGYYYVRWDRAVPVEVVASSEAEAYEKLWALSPKLRAGWQHTAVIDSIEEMQP